MNAWIAECYYCGHEYVGDPEAIVDTDRWELARAIAQLARKHRCTSTRSDAEWSVVYAKGSAPFVLRRSG